MSACANCLHVSNTQAKPEFWKCAAPKGNIAYVNALTGKPDVKRVWNFCEGERSSSSTGCGEAGAWFEQRPATDNRLGEE